VTACTTFGPVMNMWLFLSTMKMKSVSAGEYTEMPAQLPMMADIWGTMPEAWVLG
jgi:hypothetical protein